MVRVMADAAPIRNLTRLDTAQPATCQLMLTDPIGAQPVSLDLAAGEVAVLLGPSGSSQAILAPDPATGKVVIGRCEVADQRRPVVVLVDAASDVDVENRGETLDLLHRLAREGLAVLIVTTDPTLTKAATGKVAVLDDGRLLQVGTATSLRRAPNSRRVLEIIGGTDVSFLPARVTVSNLVATTDGTALGWAVPGTLVSSGQPVEVALDGASGDAPAADPPLIFDAATRLPIGRLIVGGPPKPLRGQ